MKLTAAFAGSMYSISKKQHILIMSSLVIIFICGILSIVLYALISHSYGVLFVIPSLILYNFISIYMVYTFLSKLNKLIKDSARQDDSVMINTIVRYITTSIVAYTSSILLLGLCIILVQFPGYDQIGYTLPIIDGIINLLALYFQYNFAKNDYDKCCSLCHISVLHCLNIYQNKAALELSNIVL